MTIDRKILCSKLMLFVNLTCCIVSPVLMNISIWEDDDMFVGSKMLFSVLITTLFIGICWDFTRAILDRISGLTSRLSHPYGDIATASDTAPDTGNSDVIGVKNI